MIQTKEPAIFHGTLVVLMVPRIKNNKGFVLKIAREGDSSHLEREADALRAVHKCVPVSQHIFVPLPIHTGRIDGHPYSVQSLLCGRTSLHPITRRVFRGLVLRRCINWIAQLGVTTLHDAGAAITTEVKEITQGVGSNELRGGLMSKVERAVEVVQETKENIPCVLQHGDYWLGNIVFSSSLQLRGVFDWESCRVRGWPGCDCVNFCLSRSCDQMNIMKWLTRYCNTLGHRSITPRICCALAIIDRIRIGALLRQISGRGIAFDADNMGPLVSAIPLL